MTALANQRRMENLIDGLLLPFEHPCKATKVFYKGALVALDSGGFLVPAAATAGLRCAGVVDTGSASKKDTTGESDGDTVLRVQVGIFPFKNSADGDAIVQADVLKDCYLVDDQTVAKTDGGVGRGVAGTVVKVESATKIWVAVGISFTPAQLASIAAGGGQGYVAPTTVTAGAIPLTTRTTFVSITGTQAYTLAAGLFLGQRKTIRVTVAASTPDGTLTPAAVSGYTSIDLDAVNESVELEWNGTAWLVVTIVGATLN